MDKKSIFLALFIFIVIGLAFYFSFYDLALVPEEPVVEDDSPDEELKGVEFTIYNDQKNMKLRLKSDKVDNFKKKQLMKLKPVKVKVYSTENEELLYTLDGDFGRYYTARKYLEVRDNVVLDSEEYHITAAELDYEIQKNYIKGRGSVKITAADFNSTADNFSSNLNLKDLKLSEGDSSSRAKIILKELQESSKTEVSNDE